MKLLHILTGTYCRIAPEQPIIINPEKNSKWLVDITYYGEIWTCPTTNITVEFWDYLWDNKKLSYFWFSNYHIKFSENIICKNEFELVD